MTVLKNIQSLVLPLPVTLTTCRAKPKDPGTDNIIALSWVGIVEHKPHMVNIVIGNKKYSAKIISKTREFGLCIASADLMDKVDVCGYTHGDRVDKFELTGLTRLPAEKTDLSLIKECPVCLECAVREIINGNTHDIFIGEVVCTHIGEKFLGKDGEIEMGKMNILSYMNDEYWTVGKKLKDLYYSKKGE